MQHSTGLLVGIAMLATLGFTSRAQAQAPSETRVYLNDPSGNLYEFDATTGLVTWLFYEQGMFSISAGPAANTIYYTITGYNNAPLASYDLVEHTSTLIGGAVGGNALGEGRDGYLYRGNGDSLRRVDPETGEAIFVRQGPEPFAGDLAADPTDPWGPLYAVVNTENGYGPPALVTIDRRTGVQTHIGFMGVADSSFWGIGFSLNGVLYGGGPTILSTGEVSGAIWSIDKATGQATLVCTVDFLPYDMATQPYDVPEPPALWWIIEEVIALGPDAADAVDALQAAEAYLEDAAEALTESDANKLRRNAIREIRRAVLDLDALADQGVDTGSLQADLAKLAGYIVADSVAVATTLPDVNEEQLTEAQSAVLEADAAVAVEDYSGALTWLFVALVHLKNAVY